MIKRLIPQFLLKGNRLVKGTQFSNFADVGDPLSQAMIYDAQGAEEIIIVDIEATSQHKTINPKVIEKMITNCRLPIGAGGGIRTLADAKTCFQAGADKIILNTAAVENPQQVKLFADEFGAANVVVSVDVKRNQTSGYMILSRSGTHKISDNLPKLLQQLTQYGAGEIMLTSVEQEGALTGLDIDLYKLARKYVSVPLIAAGGSGKYDDLVHVFLETDCDAVALGKMLFLRDYDIVRIKSYLRSKHISVRET